MSKADEAALADSFKYGSGPFEAPVQGWAPLGADPYGIYPAAVEPEPEVSSPSSKTPAESAPKKES